VTPLLVALGWRGEYRMEPLPGGANNRVFRIDVDGLSALLKSYFCHPEDARDRLGAEFAFSQFAWNNGLRCLPRPLASDPINHLGLYEFVPGRRLLAAEITEAIIEEAIWFYRQLNTIRFLPAARHLPLASEACFSIAAHLKLIEARIDRLSRLDETSGIDEEAARFAREELLPAWRSVRDRACEKHESTGATLEEKMAEEHWRLSPSDFGFHNAIAGADGRLRFIDFEYAGWDDPAKIVCDFFCQPELPVPSIYFSQFARGVLADLPESMSSRVEVLLPVYQIKWCCILLNHFLPVDSRRRSFAAAQIDLEDFKRRQLAKARAALQKVQTASGRFQ